MHLTGVDFCEHMCFLGSVKYPGENEYKSYLAQHGGHSNASTSMHFTTYKFDILAEHAEHAIDVFANFFIQPLFTVSGTSREVHAVDSENSKNLSADVRRRLQVLKDIGDPNHYYTKFSTGNAKTIPTHTAEQVESVRDALLAFHRKHYQPENLTVVIAGPQSLDQLQDWIVSRFESMKAAPFPLDPANPSVAEQLIEDAAKDVPSYHFAAPIVPYQSAFYPNVQKLNGSLSWPILVTNKPIRSMRKLVVMFPVPSVYKVPDQSPVSLLSHLLGHEGPGSSFAVLQNMGWISSLSAGSRVSAPDFTLFQIELTLTIPGEKHWKDVVRVIFLHCQLIAEEAERMKNSFVKDSHHDLSRIWDEKAKLNAMFFQEASPGDVYSFAPSLCNSVVLYGTKNCLAAGSMIHEKDSTFPHESFLHFAKLLVPSNCIVERCSETAWEEMEEQYKIVPNDVAKKTEPWYTIDYFVSHVGDLAPDHWCGGTISSDRILLHEVQQQLTLPRPNEYIPRSLDLCAELPEEAKIGPRIDKEIVPPNLIVDDNQIGRLWHRLDDRYALPKSTLTFLIRNAAVENVLVNGVWQYDSDAAVHSSLLSAIFSSALAQETYDASLAGLYWNLSLSMSGIKLQCSGFSDRLPDLALKVLHSFLSPEFIQDSFFGAAKDRLERSLRTYFESRRADAHAFYYRDFLLSSVDLGTDQALMSLQSVTLESIKAHHATLLQNRDIKIDCLFSGNVSAQEAKTFFSKASKKLIEAQQVELDCAPIWCPGTQKNVYNRETLSNCTFKVRTVKKKMVQLLLRINLQFLDIEGLICHLMKACTARQQSACCVTFYVNHYLMN